MRGILVLLDGLGDLPCKQLNEKTPLDVAKTPNLDFFASRGQTGLMYSVKEDFAPQSDEAVISIFGNKLSSSSRGQLEAAGSGVEIKKGDLALRVNFATIDSFENRNIIDRRAGRTLTNLEAMELAKAINKIEMPFQFLFKPTIQHRGVLILRGNFPDKITGNDEAYSNGKIIETTKAVNFKALEDYSHYTANTLNEFMEKVFKVLENHPINEKRRYRGLLPANYLLMRGAGSDIPKLKQYRKWMSVAYMPLEMGISKLSGMTPFSFEYPPLEGLDSYENLWDGLKKAVDFTIKTINKNHKNFDYAYVHIKETDLPGHDNKPIEKKDMIEYLDRTLFKALRDFSVLHQVKIVVTGDHSTPCRLKGHSADPVPVVYYMSSTPKQENKNSSVSDLMSKFFWRKDVQVNLEEMQKKNETYEYVKFCEKNVANGKLGKFNGNQLFRKVKFLK